jgi:hypothetical protein
MFVCASRARQRIHRRDGHLQSSVIGRALEAGKMPWTRLGVVTLHAEATPASFRLRLYAMGMRDAPPGLDEIETVVEGCAARKDQRRIEARRRELPQAVDCVFLSRVEHRRGAQAQHEPGSLAAGGRRDYARATERGKLQRQRAHGARCAEDEQGFGSSHAKDVIHPLQRCERGDSGRPGVKKIQTPGDVSNVRRVHGDVFGIEPAFRIGELIGPHALAD